VVARAPARGIPFQIAERQEARGIPIESESTIAFSTFIDPSPPGQHAGMTLAGDHPLTFLYRLA
jgi:hypothetical protein